MNWTNSYISCGVIQIYDIHSSRPRDILASVLRQWMACAMIVFSDNNTARKGYGGYALAAYISKHSVGTITSTVEAENPNSGNTIGTWIWKVTRDDINNHLRRTARKPRAKRAR